MTNEPVNTREKIGAYLPSLLSLGVVFRVLEILLLVPLVGGIFRLGLAFSGRSVIADVDIVYFVIGPIGAICCISIAAIQLAFLSIELVGFLGSMGATSQNQSPTILDILRFAFGKTKLLLRITYSIVVRLILYVIPFLALVGLVYWLLLSKHDINFYMANSPTEWIVALSIVSVLGVAFVGLIVFELANWFFVFPLVTASNTTPHEAVQQSKELIAGKKRGIFLKLIAILAAFSLLNAIAFFLVYFIGSILLGLVWDSLGWMIVVVGVILSLWFFLFEFLTISLKVVVAFLMRYEFGKLHSVEANSNDKQATTIPTSNSGGRRRNLGVSAGFMALGILFSSIVGIAFAKSIVIDDNCIVHAHRGASGSAPENTMAAIRAAIEQKADYVEIDVQEIKDGQVVVFHDSDFMRQSNNPLNIWDATQSDIEQLEIGSWFAPEFKNEFAPLLSDVLDLCKGKIKVNIELKYYGHDQKLEERVITLVEEKQMENDVVLMSLKKKGVEKVQKLRPDWTVGLLAAVAAGDLTTVDVDFLAVKSDLASRDFVKTAHSNGKQVFVWTVNDPVSISRMISLGVDGVITDEPGIARSVLDFRAGLSPPERLALEVAEFLGVSKKVFDQ